MTFMDALNLAQGLQMGPNTLTVPYIPLKSLNHYVVPQQRGTRMPDQPVNVVYIPSPFPYS
jgi:hypothetical protein